MLARLFPVFDCGKTVYDEPVFTGAWAVVLSSSGELIERHDFESYGAAIDFAHNSLAIEVEVMTAGPAGTLDYRTDI